MNGIQEYTAEKSFDSNVNTYCVFGEVITETIKKAAISAIQEYGSLRCYQLLTELAELKFGNDSRAIAKFRYEWLRDNIT